MNEMTIALTVGTAFLAVAIASVVPVARRLGAKRPGYFPSFISVLLLLLSAVFFAQVELSSGWALSATFLFGVVAFALVLGLSLFRGAVALVLVVTIFFACMALYRLYAKT